MDILVSWWEGSCFCLGVGSIPYFPAFHRGGPWERWWVAHSALLIVTLYATPPSSMPSFPPLLWLRTIWKSILFSRSVRLHALAVTTFLQILLRTKVRKGSGSKLDYSKDVWDIPQLLRTKMPLEIMHKKTIEASGNHYKSFADDASVTFSFTLLIPIYLFSYAVDRKKYNVNCFPCHLITRIWSVINSQARWKSF